MTLQLYKLQGCIVGGGVTSDDVSRIARLPEVGNLMPSQTHRVALHEAAKSSTQVRSSWWFRMTTFKFTNIRQGGDCWKMCQIFFIKWVTLDLCCNYQ